VGKESERVITLDVAVEDELRPGKKTDRHLRLSDGGKATRDGAGELRRNELIADLRRAVRDVLKAVVTHGRNTPVEALSSEAPRRGRAFPRPVPDAVSPPGRST